MKSHDYQDPPDAVQPPSTMAAPAGAEDSLTAQKEVEFYAATVNAWYATTLEHDKSLFVLAGGGIGIMISLLTTVGFDSSWVLALFLTAIFSFLNCLYYLLRIFEGNRHYLEAIIARRGYDADANLKRWDRIAKNSFLFGVMFATAVGLAVSASKIAPKQMERTQMTSENQTSPERGAEAGNVESAAPLQPQGKSFQGAASLTPGAPATSAVSSASSAVSATSTASSAAQPVSTQASAPAPVAAAAGAPTPAAKP